MKRFLRSGLLDFVVVVIIVSLFPAITFSQNLEWVHFTPTNSELTDDYITALTMDNQGKMWVGTIFGGLSKFDGITWTTYHMDNSKLPDNSITALATDSEDNIWIGTRQNGLVICQEDGLALDDIQVSVEESNLPTTFVLSQNYPNPFNPTTEIGFVLPNTSYVTLEVFNALGQKLTTLVDARIEAGNHQVLWDGSGFTTGIYFYRLKTESFSKTMKMLLTK